MRRVLACGTPWGPLPASALDDDHKARCQSQMLPQFGAALRTEARVGEALDDLPRPTWTRVAGCSSHNSNSINTSSSSSTKAASSKAGWCQC